MSAWPRLVWAPMQRCSLWRLTHGLCVILSAPLSGCAPWQTQEAVTPSSYQHSRAQVERSVGKLRRLAVLQIHQQAPSECHAGSAGEARFTAVPDEVLDQQLRHDKGYEVIVPDLLAVAQTTSFRSEAFLAEATQWQVSDETAKVGPTTRQLLDHLRQRERADGLLVLRVASTCENADRRLRGLLSVMTLGLHAKWPEPRTLELFSDCTAWIYESAKARLVWQHRITQCDPTLPSRGLMKRTELRELLAPLETAVPRILTR